MTVFLVALAVASGSYALVVAALAVVVRRAPSPPPPVPDDALPDVAVLVAARDEEATIARCLAALRAQDYPPERLTVVVADDHSTDRTAAVVRGLIRQPAAVPAGAGDDAWPEAPAPTVRLVRVPEPEGSLRGKAQALHTAIETTTAPFLLVTDADCAPPPGWVRAAVGALRAAPDVGIACGMSRIAPRSGVAFDRAQALDWVFLLGGASALAESGVPATGVGNNMALRREAYDAVGGYPALPFSVTEDFTLVQAVVGTGRWRLRYPLAPESTVWTLPASGLRHAYGQRRRWALGGLGGGPAVWTVYTVLHAAFALPLVALAVAPAAGLAAVLAMVAADVALVGATMARTGPPLAWRDVPLALAFRWFYLATLPATLVLWPRIGWKGRRHGRRWRNGRRP